MNRKVLSILLVLTLVFSLYNAVNVPVFAEGSISLSGNTYQPYEYMTVTLSGITSTSNAWVGIIPADINSDYDEHDVAYAWISDVVGNQWTVRLPKAEGRYKVGVFLDSENDRLVAMSGVVSSYHNSVSVSLNKNSFKPDEEVVVNISSKPVEASSAWVGLIPAGVTENYDDHDIKYVWVNDMANLQWIFKAPLTEGSYQVGVFLDDAADQKVGISSVFTVGREQISISLSKDKLQPGDTITVSFSEFPVESTTWLGLLPANVNANYDDNDIMYTWLTDTSNNQWTFNMPWIEGDYKVGLFVDNQDDYRLGMSSVFTSKYHTIIVTPNKTGYLKGELVTVSLSEIPVGPSAWVGLVPSNITDDYDSHDISFVWAKDLENKTWSFSAPDISGSYKIGVFLDSDSDKVVGMSQTFMFGQSGAATTTNTTTTTTTTTDKVTDLPELNFSDFNNSHWSYPYVQHMVSLGIITGYPDNTFKPNDAFSRAAFAKLLALSFDLPLYSASNEIYTDIPNTHWAYGYIMSSNEYLTAYAKTDGSKVFLPNNDALREDVAVAMVKAMKLDPNDADMSYLEAYTDANEVSENLRNYVALAIEHGVMQGSNGFFKPQNVLTRAEASTLFSRYLTDIKVLDEDDGLIKITN